MIPKNSIFFYDKNKVYDYNINCLKNKNGDWDFIIYNSIDYIFLSKNFKKEFCVKFNMLSEEIKIKLFKYCLIYHQ